MSCIVSVSCYRWGQLSQKIEQVGDATSIISFRCDEINLFASLSFTFTVCCDIIIVPNRRHIWFQITLFCNGAIQFQTGHSYWFSQIFISTHFQIIMQDAFSCHDFIMSLYNFPVNWGDSYQTHQQLTSYSESYTRQFLTSCIYRSLCWE